MILACVKEIAAARAILRASFDLDCLASPGGLKLSIILAHRLTCALGGRSGAAVATGETRAKQWQPIIG